MAKTEHSTSKNIFSWSNIIFLILCTAVFYFVVHDFTQLKTVNMLFKQVDGRWIVLAVIAQFCTYLSTALIYYFLMNKFKDRTSVTVTDFFKLTIVTVFINQIVPSGGIGGNGFLFNELSKRGVHPKKAFFTIVMECLFLYISLAVLMIVLPIIYISYYTTLPHLFLIVILFGFVLFGALSALMTLLSNKNRLQRAIKKLSHIKFLKHFLQDITFSPEGTFAEYKTKGPWGIFLKYKKQSLAVIAGQFGVFFADSLTIIALLHGLHVHIAYIVVMLGLLLTFIVATLPISPGALLIYEGAMTFFYTSMGMPFGTALIVTLLYRVLSFWIPIVFGLLLYKHVQTGKK